MVAKVIMYSIKAKPQFDGSLKNWGIHVKPQALREHNEGSMRGKTDKRRALSATEDELSSKLKSWSSTTS